MKKTIKYNWELLFGGFFGLFMFFYICGWTILNPMSSNWMLVAGSDTANHVILWYFYRNADWSFPLTLFNTASYPYWQSAMHADIIPLFAIPFKLISKLFFNNNSQFHYFGIVILFNFIMQGIIGSYLIKQIVNNKFVVLIGTMILVISPIMLFRMPVHIALSSHWIILLALLCFFKRISIIKQWLIVILSLFIHPYIYFMVLIIISANMIREWMNDNNIICTEIYQIKNVLSIVKKFIVGILINVVGLYIIGYFSINTINSMGKCSMWSSNLNALINPVDTQFANFIRPMPSIMSIGSCEGFSYLGFGVILGICLLLPKIINKLNNKQWWFNNRILLIMTLFFFLFAISRNIYLGNTSIINIWLPNIIEHVYAMFRSCERMMWVVWYLIIIFMCYFLNNIKDKYLRILICIIIILFQFYDLAGNNSGLINYKWNEFYQYKNKNLQKINKNVDINKKHLFFNINYGNYCSYYNMLPIIRTISLKNKTINNFNFGRTNPNCLK